MRDVIIRVLEKAGFSELTHEIVNASVEMGAIPGLSVPPPSIGSSLAAGWLAGAARRETTATE